MSSRKAGGHPGAWRGSDSSWFPGAQPRVELGAWAALDPSPASAPGLADALHPRSPRRSVLFAVASALVNCTNSYDYEEPTPRWWSWPSMPSSTCPSSTPR